jgi:hypothetical protein
MGEGQKQSGPRSCVGPEASLGCTRADRWVSRGLPGRPGVLDWCLFRGRRWKMTDKRLKAQGGPSSSSGLPHTNTPPQHPGWEGGKGLLSSVTERLGQGWMFLSLVILGQGGSFHLVTSLSLFLISVCCDYTNLLTHWFTCTALILKYLLYSMGFMSITSHSSHKSNIPTVQMRKPRATESQATITVGIGQNIQMVLWPH